MKALLTFILLLLSQSCFADFTTATDAYRNKNYTQAYAEYKQLAVLGNKRAQFNLAVMHLRGEGVAKDLTEAFAWLTLAQDEAYPKYATSLERVSNKLSAEQLIIGKEKANLLLESYATDKLLTKTLPIQYAENEQGNKPAKNYTVTPINKVQPIMPAKLQRSRHRGWVTIEFEIYPDGSARNLRAVDAFPDEALNKASIEAISKWKYKVSFTNNSEPRPVPATQTIVYAVNDRKGKFKNIYTKRLEAAKQRAENENPRSQYLYAIAANVSVFVDQENFIEQSEVNKWLLRSAQNGNNDAQYQLGINILRGKGCKTDKQKGLFWITQSANNGNDLAAMMTYKLLHSSDNINNTGKTAEQWLKQSATAGNPDAMIEWSRYMSANEGSDKDDLQLARQYLSTSKKDRTKSVKWYLASAELYKRTDNPSKAESETKKAKKLAKKLGWEAGSLSAGM